MLSKTKRKNSSSRGAIICSILVLVFIACSVHAVENAPTSTLEIICPKNQKIDSRDLKLTLLYVNHSSETIILPMIYMKAVNIQEFVFPNRDVRGGIVSDYSIPSEVNNEPCKIEDMEGYEHLRYILPLDTLEVVYNLNQLGYENVEGGYKKGKKYDYFVNLNIPSEFKNICSNMWVGQITSGNGSFIIE